MAFNSNLFMFLFLPLCLLFYYLSKDSIKNYILLIASLIFYLWGSHETFIIILLTIVINFLLTIAIDKQKNDKAKIFMLIISLIFNIAVLAYYKYMGFFLSSVNILISNLGFSKLMWRNPAVPIGLSYITFQQISYAVDTYKGKDRALYNIFDFSLYILLFPRLIAGPIVRYHDIAPQLKHREHTLEKFSQGIYRLSLGLGKKVLIANNLAAAADHIFKADPSMLGIKYAWFGMLLYTFQIYFDFSGYSDMALGLGKMFGFELPENFNRPYIASSVTEFWRRWHISLSNFLRDYIYIPLGGNRCSKKRNYLNLWIVFFICGLWHGAALTFVVWGIYHGIILIIEKLFMRKALKKLPNFISNILTFILVAIGWVFFRSENLTYALKYIKSLFTLSFAQGIDFYSMGITNKTFAAFFLAFILSFARFDGFKKYASNTKLYDKVKYVFSIVLLLYSLASLSTGSFNPFIYFKF